MTAPGSKPKPKPNLDGRDLLAAFRAERGPARHVEDRLWARLEADIETGIDEPERIATGPSRRTVLTVAAVVLAAAAAVVLTWPFGRTLDARAVDDPKSQAPHEARDDDGVRVMHPRERARAHEPPLPAKVAEPPVLEPDGASDAERVDEPAAPIRSAPHRARHRASSSASVPSAPAPAPAKPPMPAAGDSLAAETELVRRARGALSQGRADLSLSLLGDYDERFGDGVLQEEAQAVLTMAKCRLHPGDRAALGEAFTRSHGKSLFLDQVAAACTAPPATADPQ